jgi:hypothetical protein
VLGEATPGASQFYRARAAITRRLIERHGFNIVAVDAARIDRTLAFQADVQLVMTAKAASGRLSSSASQTGSVLPPGPISYIRKKDVNGTMHRFAGPSGRPMRRCRVTQLVTPGSVVRPLKLHFSHPDDWGRIQASAARVTAASCLGESA